MKKYLKKLTATMLAIAIAAPMALTAFALPASLQTGKAEFTKRLTTTGSGVAIPSYSFSFTVTPVSVDGDTAATALSVMPALSGSAAFSTALGAWNAPGGVADADPVYWYKDVAVDLTTGVTWPHAGEYVYTVTENASGLTGVTDSQAAFQLTIQVMNGTPLVVTNVEFKKLQDDGGTTIAAANQKVEAVFTNHYDVSSNLAITKTVTGLYGDLTKVFSFGLNLTLAPGSAGTETYTGTITPGSTTVTFGAGTTSFSLKHGETMTIAAMPVGTRYTLTENITTQYKPSASVVVNGAAALTETAANYGDSLYIGDGVNTINTQLNAPISIGQNANTVAVGNEYYTPPTPTGILLDNLPFIIMIIVAIGGFAGFIALKRRRAHQE